VGGGVSYDSSSVGLTGSGHVDMKSYLGAIYAAWFTQGLHIEGMAGGGLNSYNTRRQGLQGLAKGSTDGVEWNGLLGGGYDWHNGSWSYGPGTCGPIHVGGYQSIHREGIPRPAAYRIADARFAAHPIGR